MKNPAALFLLGTMSLGVAASANAQSHNTYSQPTSAQKAERKQAKAQKKYAKKQKKAMKKMLKTSKKNTHYPQHQF